MRRIQMAFDVDGFLRNFVKGALLIIEEVTGKKFAPADIATFDFAKALGLSERETRAVMQAISDRRGFVTALPPYEKARQGVRRMRELGDVFCVTTPWELHASDGTLISSNPWWRDESEAWLALHFGIDRVHHAHDKTAYEADLFVDDRSKNVRTWLSAWPDRSAVFWLTPHNRSEAIPAGAHATSSWDDLYQIAREIALGPVQPSLPMEVSP